jgi:hypothetical protein
VTVERIASLDLSDSAFDATKNGSRSRPLPDFLASSRRILMEIEGDDSRDAGID